MNSRQDFLDLWERNLAVFSEFNPEDAQTKVCARMLADFRAVCRADDERTLSVAEAAALVGKPRETIERAIRVERLPNAGRKGKPLVRRTDLLRVYPLKTVENSMSRTYDPIADGRSLRGTRRGGA